MSSSSIASFGFILFFLQIYDNSSSRKIKQGLRASLSTLLLFLKKQQQQKKKPPWHLRFKVNDLLHFHLHPKCWLVNQFDLRCHLILRKILDNNVKEYKTEY